MLIHLLRFFRGTLSFQVKGKYVERFLNLSARARIPIWNGKREEQSFCGETLLSKEEMLRKLAKKVQLEWVQSEFYGAPKWKHRYRRRIGIGLGAVLLIFTLLLSEQFVWRVEVRGNQRTTRAEIIESASELGLKPGVWKRRLDVLKIADCLCLQYEDISWAAVNLLGTVAEIEIVERVLPPTVIDQSRPCNVIAEKAGTLVELELYEGQQVARVGDTIKQGGLIATGILQDKKGRTYYTHARAKAVIEYNETVNVAIPLKEQMFVPAGVLQNQYRCLIGAYSLPLSIGAVPNKSGFPTIVGFVEAGIYQNEENTWFYSVHNQRVVVKGFCLPLYVQIQQYIPTQRISVERTLQQAKKLARLELQTIKRQRNNQEIEIVNEECSVLIQDNSVVLSAKWCCREEIGKEIEIYMESTH